MVCNKLREFAIKDRPHYNSNTIISIEDLFLKNMKVEKNLSKILLLTTLDMEKVHGVKHLYFVFHEKIAYIEDDG